MSRPSALTSCPRRCPSNGAPQTSHEIARALTHNPLRARFFVRIFCFLVDCNSYCVNTFADVLLINKCILCYNVRFLFIYLNLPRMSSLAGSLGHGALHLIQSENLLFQYLSSRFLRQKKPSYLLKKDDLMQVVYRQLIRLRNSDLY